MTVRSLLNVAEAHLVEGLDAKSKTRVLEMLVEPFDSELSPAERARAERKRIAMRTGALDSQADLLGAMKMKPKRVR